MIVIIGAGLIGLSVAYELAKRGADVHVVEAYDSAASTSWSSAGRLAPFTDSEGSEQQEDFLATALGLYQVFVKELHKRTGIDPYLRIDGIIDVALDEAAALRLRDRADSLVARGIHAHWLEADEVRRLEPSLGPATVGASLIEEEGHIDNRQLGDALRAACADVGVRIEERTGPVALESDGARALGVRASGNFIAAEAVVNAAGAWAGEVDGVPPHVRVPILPVKGQLVVLTMPRRMVARVLMLPGAYVVPRTDGTLVVGETAEETGFDVRVDPAGTQRLLDAALRAMPALADLHDRGDVGRAPAAIAERPALHRRDRARELLRGGRTRPQRDPVGARDVARDRERGRGETGERAALTKAFCLSFHWRTSRHAGTR